MLQEFIINENGQGTYVNDGALGRGLRSHGGDTGTFRPYTEDDPSARRYGQRCVTVNTGRFRIEERTNPQGQKVRHRIPIRRSMTLNEAQRAGIALPPVAFTSNAGALLANATGLRKEEWIQFDTKILRASRYRLRAWADLAGANSFGGFNAMAKSILEHETMSDPGEAIVDMNGISEGRGDAPKFQLEGLPLPITHSDFWFDARRLAESRNSGTPLDTSMGEAAGRRIAEAIEKTLIGNQTGVTYGGASTYVGGYGRTSQVYGYLTFPNRLTKTNAYKPTGNGRSGTGWVAADTLKDVLAALDQLRLGKFYGPFQIYHSNDWDQYLDGDYILTGGNVATQTLRERLTAIKGIEDVKRLDMLFASAPSANPSSSSYTGPGGEHVAANYAFTMIFVQMTEDVAQAVNGMDITTIQWETRGGMQLNFKVLCIQVPRLRADFYGNCGILQMTANN